MLKSYKPLPCVDYRRGKAISLLGRVLCSAISVWGIKMDFNKLTFPKTSVTTSASYGSVSAHCPPVRERKLIFLLVSHIQHLLLKTLVFFFFLAVIYSYDLPYEAMRIVIEMRSNGNMDQSYSRALGNAEKHRYEQNCTFSPLCSLLQPSTHSFLCCEMPLPSVIFQIAFSSFHILPLWRNYNFS